MAPSPPSATTAAGCTRTPMSRACGCCAGAVEQGHSIGRLAGLTDAELHRLAVPAGAIAAPAADPVRPTSLDTAALSAALQKYDAAAIDQEIARLAAVLRPLDLLRDVLMPVLVQVGDDWHRGRAGIAQEHLMSSTVRHILGSFLRLYAQPDARSGCSLRPPRATATRSARLARRCSPPAAAWASRISGRIFPRGRLSRA